MALWPEAELREMDLLPAAETRSHGRIRPWSLRREHSAAGIWTAGFWPRVARGSLPVVLRPLVCGTVF